MRPRVLPLMGDTADIEPESRAKMAADLPDEAAGVQIVVTGDNRVSEAAQSVTGTRSALPRVD